MPIIKSLSAAAGSNPIDDSRLKMGAFLTQVTSTDRAGDDGLAAQGDSDEQCKRYQ